MVLPPPINGTEQRLDALLDELRALRAELAAQRPQPPVPPAIELREPKLPKRGSGRPRKATV